MFRAFFILPASQFKNLELSPELNRAPGLTANLQELEV